MGPDTRHVQVDNTHNNGEQSPLLPSSHNHESHTFADGIGILFTKQHL